MRDGEKHAQHPGPGQKRTTRRAGLLAGAVACVALLFTACGGSGGSGTGSGSPTTVPASNSTGGGTALAYAVCMRSHGVSKFPDPNKTGGFTATGAVNRTSPRFQAATKACQSKEGTQLSQAKQAQMESRMLKYAACMRTHGVPGYPDPTFSNGGVSQSMTGIDTKSPQFEAATRTCKHDEDG